MAFKDLIVHVHDPERSRARLEVAVDLAHGYGAHLTGLHVIPFPQIASALVAELGPQVIELQQRRGREAAEKAAEAFRAATQGGAVAAEWRVAEGDPAETFALHARYADLAIIGQADPEVDDIAVPQGLPDRLVMAVGGPILIVPYAGRFPKVGERVLVAWNASREATRAVRDALPILKAARKVLVLAVNPEGGPRGHGEIPGADISQHLARHGVEVEAQSIAGSDVDVGDFILSRAADQGADLIVMGGYGHSRLREFVLGGATAHLLRFMTMPVLMSH